MGWLHAIGNWIYYFFGFSGSGSHYGWWSGAGSDLGEVTIIGGMYAIWKTHNSAAKHCPWIGKHPVAGTGTKTCHLHSTLAKHQELHEAHAREHPDQHALFNPAPPAPAPVPAKRTVAKRVTKKIAKPVKVAKKVTKAKKAAKPARKR